MRSSFRTGLILGGGSLACSLPGGGGEGRGLLGFIGERGERGPCRVFAGVEAGEYCLFIGLDVVIPWTEQSGTRRHLG